MVFAQFAREASCLNDVVKNLRLEKLPQVAVLQKSKLVELLEEALIVRRVVIDLWKGKWSAA